MSQEVEKLAAALFGGRRLEASAGTPGETVTAYATAAGPSSDGTVEIDFGGPVTYPDGPDDSQEAGPIQVPTNVSVIEGDVVQVSLVGSGPGKAPVVVGVAGGGDRTAKAIAEKASSAELEAFKTDANTRLTSVEESSKTNTTWREGFTDTYLNDEKPEQKLVEQSQLTQTATTIQSTVSEAFTTYKDVTDAKLADDATQLADLQSRTSTLEQTADGFQATVTKADALEGKVNEINGRMRFTTDDDGNPVIVLDASGGSTDGFEMRLSNTTLEFVKDGTVITTVSDFMEISAATVFQDLNIGKRWRWVERSNGHLSLMQREA